MRGLLDDIPRRGAVHLAIHHPTDEGQSILDAEGDEVDAGRGVVEPGQALPAASRVGAHESSMAAGLGRCNRKGGPPGPGRSPVPTTLGGPYI